MPKNPNIKNIISYLREEKRNTILSSDINNVSTLTDSIKDEAVEKLEITDYIWKSNKKHITLYIRALLTIKHLKDINTDTYDKLFNCKSKDEVLTLLSGKLPDGYSNSHHVCKHIISEIKYLIKNPNLLLEETPKSDTSETDEVIDNTITPKESTEQSNISDKNKTKKKIAITAKALNKVIESDNELLNKLLIITDDEIKKSILEKFKDTYNISLEVIGEWINTYKNKRPIVLEENKTIKELAILKESSAEKIKNLHCKNTELLSEISHLKDKNSTLISELEDANKQLENYKYKTPNLSPKHVFSVELKELNRLLNSNLSESHITIKDEILNRVSKYIDEYSLIKIEDIINKNRDLKSEIVQIILLAFLHEKSLL
ncbi:hypothetical protein ACQPUY_08410 [Clostridium nigeriense]|uniref:hypothetical protein n=1 Tax=Clostridium nigeriense TaxID=1805470 RepID=UPI003D34C3DD